MQPLVARASLPRFAVAICLAASALAAPAHASPVVIGSLEWQQIWDAPDPAFNVATFDEISTLFQGDPFLLGHTFFDQTWGCEWYDGFCVGQILYQTVILIEANYDGGYAKAESVWRRDLPGSEIRSIFPGQSCTWPGDCPDFRVRSIPEPSTGLLVLTGLLGLAARRWGCA